MQEIPTKVTGSSLSADEFNNIPDEMENAILDTSQTLTGADRHQQSKAMAVYAGTGDHYTDSGSADNYVLSPKSPLEAPPALQDGMRLRFKAANTNTGASQVNAFATGNKPIKKYGADTDLVAGDIQQDAVIELVYIQSLNAYELVSIEDPIVRESLPLIKSISGLTIENNLGAPTTDIDFYPGWARDSVTPNVFSNSGVFVKRATVAWAAGTGNGGTPASLLPLAPGTFLYCFALAKADGTFDAGFDTSITAVNLLAAATGYIRYRRVGTIYYIASGITQFYMLVYDNGRRDTFWKEPVRDGLYYNLLNPPISTPVIFQAYVPPGIFAYAHLRATIGFITPIGVGDARMHIYSMNGTAPVGYLANQSAYDTTISLQGAFTPVSGITPVNNISLHTNTNRQLAYEYFQVPGANNFEIFIISLGWTE